MHAEADLFLFLLLRYRVKSRKTSSMGCASLPLDFQLCLFCFLWWLWYQWLCLVLFVTTDNWPKWLKKPPPSPRVEEWQQRPLVPMGYPLHRSNPIFTVSLIGGSTHGLEAKHLMRDLRCISSVKWAIRIKAPKNQNPLPHPFSQVRDPVGPLYFVCVLFLLASTDLLTLNYKQYLLSIWCLIKAF